MRKLFRLENLEGDSKDKTFDPFLPEKSHPNTDLVDCMDNWPNANLVSSELTNGLHSPVLDIDYEAHLVPSSTPGHYHLYLDGLELGWDKYAKLIKTLAEIGIIQEGYAASTLQRGMSLVRVPGQKKTNKSEAAF
jgi:hypothetical protein